MSQLVDENTMSFKGCTQLAPSNKVNLLSTYVYRYLHNYDLIKISKFRALAITFLLHLQIANCPSFSIQNVKITSRECSAPRPRYS